MKPTAQELWERVEEAVYQAYDYSIHSDDDNTRQRTLEQLVKDYAQAYHEEQMRDFVGITEREFKAGFINPKSPGAIYFKTYPNKNND